MEENINPTPQKNISAPNRANLFVIGSLVVLAVVIVPKILRQNNQTTLLSPDVMGTVTSTPTASETTPTPVDVVDGAITVEAGSFYYKPNLIRVKKGEKVKLTLNSVSMMHDFNIDELGIKVPVTKMGSTSTVEFTADKVGEFEFYCSVGQHRQNGQVGKLIVVD